MKIPNVTEYSYENQIIPKWNSNNPWILIIYQFQKYTSKKQWNKVPWRKRGRRTAKRGKRKTGRKKLVQRHQMSHGLTMRVEVHGEGRARGTLHTGHIPSRDPIIIKIISPLNFPVYCHPFSALQKAATVDHTHLRKLLIKVTLSTQGGPLSYLWLYQVFSHYLGICHFTQT